MRFAGRVGVWGAINRLVERELAEAEAPSQTAERALLEPFDRENGWRAKGERAIRFEMERAVARRRSA